MKNWFNNLDKKYKVLIHIVLGLTIFILSSFNDTNSAISLIQATILVLEIIFIIWHVKYEKYTSRTVEDKQTLNIKEKVNTDQSVIINDKQTTNCRIKSTINKNTKFKYPLNKTFIYVDVETANSYNNTVCAIGAIIIKNNEEKHLYSLIDPKVHITNTSIHGISDEDIVDEPTLDIFWQSISNYLNDDYIIIGHNVAFDISALTKDLKRYGINFLPIKKIDTMAIAKDLYYNYQTQSGDLKLDALCNKLNIDLNHHHPESDVTATKDVLEILLSDTNRRIEDFINVHYSSTKTIIINNIKNVRTNIYWDDIKIGRMPPYFTNWKKEVVDYTPEYDKVTIEDLIYTSMMNRDNCGINRIAKQVKLIKDFIINIGAKCFTKGSKTARSYIEYYYMDIQEYKKLRNQGYKIFHALDVEAFIINNQKEIKKYIENKQKEELAKRRKEEQLEKEKEARKLQRKHEEELKKTKLSIVKKLVQMSIDGSVIKIHDKLADAIRETGINSKSIRDCCNGKQKHAGGFVWKYIQES